MAWMWLTLAIIFEVSGTTSLKFSNGFSKLIPSILTFIFYSISFVSLSFALKKMDVGIAYSIWAGLGTALIACISFWLFHEPWSIFKTICIAFIIIGVVGLNFLGEHGVKA